MEQLVKGKSIDVSKVSTSAPKPLDNGSKLVCKLRRSYDKVQRSDSLDGINGL